MDFQVIWVNIVAGFWSRPVGLEPTTCGLEGRCSIQLSYERIIGMTGIEPAISWSQTRRHSH